MMKIRLVGRPGKIVQREGTVITVMETRKVPALPGDLPAPPEGTVKYTSSEECYFFARQST